MRSLLFERPSETANPGFRRPLLLPHDLPRPWQLGKRKHEKAV
ncbi:hypothetical protein HMPREF9120_01186 [Neisseria sp. oral taxon 020 str. F0370]|nr:hypothetical protein HMPREF9120_01186 [Neisseria sp. oral taxon 020 str. F0370]